MTENNPTRDESVRQPLLPCPFCGGAPFRRRQEVFRHFQETDRRTTKKRHQICCSSCFAETGAFDRSDEAHYAWNRRAQSARIAKLEEALKDARAKALEDAARCVEERQTNNVGMVHPIAAADAAAIRALTETK